MSLLLIYAYWMMQKPKPQPIGNLQKINLGPAGTPPPPLPPVFDFRRAALLNGPAKPMAVAGPDL